MRHLIALALLCSPVACLSQPEGGTVTPGMSQAQVVAAIGKPATLRTVGNRTYMFYSNSCGSSCGMNDLVILSADSVVDAIFRSPDRTYTGRSSSPAAVPPSRAAARKPDTVAPLRTRPPAKPSDATPSIPLRPPTMTPAPAAEPSPRKPTP